VFGLGFLYNIGGDNMRTLTGNKANMFFAIYMILIPIVLTIFAIFGIDFKIAYQLIAWGVVYTLFLFFMLLKLVWNRSKFQLSITPTKLIAVLMLAWILISSLVNGVFNLHTIIYISYFLIFVCFSSLDKERQRVIFNILLVVIAISCTMGFIDPRGKFMPGFTSVYPMALHFTNPNYSAYIVATLTIIVFGFFNSSTTRSLNIFYCIIYLIFATHLFVNGTFIAISSVIFVEALMQIIVGIKYKKLQVKMLILCLILIPICILVDLIPNIESIRTCKYNYFLECVAVFDNLFNTNILKLFNINKITGADGWSRSSLVQTSFKHATSSATNFIFGSGAGFFYNVRPHNAFLSLFLDFGIVMPLLFMALLSVLLIRVVKSKFNAHNFYYAMAILGFVLCSLMGSLVHHSCYVFIIILAVLFNNLDQANQTTGSNTN